MSVLLIAHGSPDPRHSAAMESFAEQVQAASGIPTTVGYLDHNAPRVDDALREATDSVLAVGLFLSSGYHVRVDVPKVLVNAATTVTDCGPLGLGDWLLPALERALATTSSHATGGHGVALVAAGSSIPEARDEVIDLAARWQSQRRAPVRAAFATGPGTTLDEAMAKLSADGCRDRVVLPLMLAPGALSDRVIERAQRDAAPVGVPLLSQDPAPPELLARVLHLISG